MRLKLQHLAIGLLAMLPMLSWAQSENEEPKQKPIQLTFQGAGDTETVESVTVENLSRGTSITVNGDEILVLEPSPTGIEETEAGFGGTEPLLYPNPAEGDGNLVFDVQQDGEVAVRIFSMDGVLMESANVPVFEGRNALSIPSQGYGYYMVSVEGNGIHFSQKWMCGAPNSGNGIRHNGTSAVELPREAIAMTRAQAPESKKFEFHEGDLLRFTATTGNMKTIVMRRPEMDHTITFQMFKCQDADGYNYPIIEVGGMLWMAEDLRPVTKAGVAVMKNATNWADPEAGELRMAYANFDVKNKDQGAYYTPRAAMKAMPEGWKLPTADELRVLTTLMGDSTTVGGLLKARGEDSNWNTPNEELDDVQLNLGANGRLKADGQFAGLGSTANIVTRSFIDGNPIRVKLSDSNSNAFVTRDELAVAGEGYTVRGVRPAMSPYNGFISNFLSEHPENAPRRIAGKDLYAGLEGNPFAYTAPLGQKYTIISGADQYIVTNALYEGNLSEVDNTFMKDLSNNQLHRYARQNMPNGLQRTIRLSWSNLSQTENNNFIEGTKMIESMFGSGTIKLEVAGDATEPDFAYEGVIDKDFYFNGIKIYEMPYIWDNFVETKGDYMNREQLQSSLQAQCADFNGDGIDDILTGMGSKIVIIDGANYKKTLFEKNFSDSKDPVLGVISCSVGDINKDGITDLVVVHQNNTHVIVEAWWEGLENFSTKEPNGYISILRENYLTHGVLVGDFNDDGNTDVIVQLLESREHQIHMFTYNRNSNRLEAVTVLNNQRTHAGLSNREMALIRARGLLKTPYLFANGYFFEWNELDKTIDVVRNVGAGTYALYIHSGDFSVGNFDNNQDGKESMLFTRKMIGPKGDRIMVETCDLCKISYNDSKNELDWKYMSAIYNREIALSSSYYKPLNFSPISAIRYKNPIREAELSSIETTMAEPRIYALLSAPPYWGDYQGKYADNGGTSWGKTKSSGGGMSTESSSTGSTIFGYEQEFNLPFIGTKVGGVDFETRLDWTSSQSSQQTTMTEYGIEYSTIWQDAVVLTFVPYTAYNYVITKSGNEDEIGNTLMIGMPDQPRTMMLGLKNYMELRADNNAIPNLRNLLQHEPGNPWSYKEKYVDAMPTTSDILWGGGEKGSFITTGSAGNTTRTIAVTTEMENTNENEFAMDITLVGTVVGVKAGGGYGCSNKNGIIHKQEVGMEVSGTVPTPDDIKEVKAFKWNFCRANVLFGGQKFPVVTYIVEQ